jgi:isopentenyl-diphosphate delta-isomerase
MDHVILVDEHDTELGTMPKLDAHRPPGHLHRAISVFAIDPGARILLQRRAASKYHFPSLWTNTCCSHPRPGESVQDAARRRLREEMGIAASPTPVGTFTYVAVDPVSGLIERELDHVCIAHVNTDPTPDPAEADDWRWVSLTALQSDLAANARAYTPWLPPALDCLLHSGAIASDR